MSMPIGSEHSNGDVYIIDVIYSKEKKEETIPRVVRAIIENGITHCFFEANNGGDMYAEEVVRELKKRNYNCYINWKKAPTTKSKLDRILAVQGAIKGSDMSDYRLLFKKRSAIRGKSEYNDALDELGKFNQSASVQGKQHDDFTDSCASLLTNVLGCSIKGKARMIRTREELGI